ncbi:MAG TPA: amidohydrolase family protein [Candidatus Dormibacteraeota bacterium]
MTEPNRVTALVADQLIDGAGGDPLRDIAVVWEGDRIASAGTRSTVNIPRDAEVIDGHGLTVLPGLMDMHVHLCAQAGMDFVSMMMTRPSYALLRAVPHSAATLRAGFTTVRDAGGTPAGVRQAVDEGLFPGPRMRLAVSILSQTGGHGDPMFPCGGEVSFTGVIDLPEGRVDGVDGMRRRVREVLRAGADVVKLCTSGGVLSAFDFPDTPEFTVEEIAAAVSEASVRGAHVLAHAMSAQGIKNALHAGVRSIEHGCLLDEEGIALLLERDAFLVPTLVAPRDVMAVAEAHPERLPEEMLDKCRRVSGMHMDAFHAAVDAGVNIALGTDSGIGEHGSNGRELALMVEGGLTPMQALAAATSAPARLLGLEHELGTLAAGRIADMIAVAGDPLEDISILGRPGSVRVVVKDGTIMAGPSQSPVPAVAGA